MKSSRNPKSLLLAHFSSTCINGLWRRVLSVLNLTARKLFHTLSWFKGPALDRSPNIGILQLNLNWQFISHLTSLWLARLEMMQTQTIKYCSIKGFYFICKICDRLPQKLNQIKGKHLSLKRIMLLITYKRSKAVQLWTYSKARWCLQFTITSGPWKCRNCINRWREVMRTVSLCKLHHENQQ